MSNYSKTSISYVNPENALLWCNFTNQNADVYTYSGQFVFTKCWATNLGKYPGAPKTVQFGDGGYSSLYNTVGAMVTTSANVPKQIFTRNGIIFDGACWVNTGLIDPFEYNTSFTLFVLYYTKPTSLQILISNSNFSATPARGIQMYLNTDLTIGVTIVNTIAAPDNFIFKSFPATTGIVSACATYSGSSDQSGVLGYINGSSVTNDIVVAKNTLTSTIKSGIPFYLGARFDGSTLTYPLTGNIYFAAIFPFALTSQQVQYLDKIARINFNKK